jgi:hypothetical protein
VWIHEYPWTELAHAGRVPNTLVQERLVAGVDVEGWRSHPVDRRQEASIAVAAERDDLEIQSRIDAARPGRPLA